MQKCQFFSHHWTYSHRNLDARRAAASEYLLYRSRLQIKKQMFKPFFAGHRNTEIFAIEGPHSDSTVFEAAR